MENEVLTATKHGLSLQVHVRRGWAVDPAWAYRLPLLRTGNNPMDNVRSSLERVFVMDNPTGKFKAVWDVKLQRTVLLRTSSLEDVDLAKKLLEIRVQASKQPQTIGPWRSTDRWWKEMEILIIAGSTTRKVERFNRTLVAECAYATASKSGSARAAGYPR